MRYACGDCGKRFRTADNTARADLKCPNCGGRLHPLDGVRGGQPVQPPLQEAADAGSTKSGGAAASASPCPEKPTISLVNASQTGNVDQVKRHIHYGCDVNAADNDGIMSLHWAALEGHKDVAELLIAKGANVNAADKNGQTPLHIAAGFGHKNVAELLIAKGANVNAADKNGWTPLYQAAVARSFGHQDVAELLIAKGANVNAKDKKGWTPLQAAAFMGHKVVVELLRKHGSHD